jgi:hypothetical protein
MEWQRKASHRAAADRWGKGSTGRFAWDNLSDAELQFGSDVNRRWHGRIVLSSLA